MMTEEELSRIRSNWNTIAGRTFGIIDNFAINRECAESLQAVPKLLAHIDDQASQIAILKAICKNERLRYNELLREQCDGYGPQYDTEEFAIKELSEWYPNVEWEDKS